MELCKESLYNAVQSKVLSEKEAARYLLQIARALEYCHERGFIHRDIKLENVLIG